MNLFTIIFVLFLTEILTQNISLQNNTICRTQQPLWKTSEYFRAGNQNVIATLTGNSSTPQYTFTFSSALPGIPNLGYGIKNYRGADYMGQEYYQIQRINLTPTSFKVQVQIFGVTNLYILNVPYIAIDPTFPHKLTSFDNVPLNYSSGDLVNISIQNASSYQQYVINFTQQGSGTTSYNQFLNPLTSNKISLFITSLFINANFASGGINYPINMTVTYSILNTQQYKLRVDLSTYAKITRLHFSQIIFNYDDVKASNQYLIIYKQWITDNMGGFISIPYQFVDNFIMAVTSFHTIDGKCGFQYNWQFQNSSTYGFGVNLNQSIQVSGACGFSYIVSSIFYIKTWICGSNYVFFDNVNDLCNQCEICNPALNLFVNYTTKRCSLCDLNQCLKCANLYQCQTCNSSNMYALNISTLLCDECTLVGCINCQTTQNCTQCNRSSLFVLNQTINRCFYCNISENYVINDSSITEKCIYCPLNECLSCIDFNNCNACNVSNGYVLNLTTLHCQPCSIQGCTLCLNITSCDICNSTNHYFLNETTLLCQVCQASNCLSCKTIDTCLICNQSNSYFVNTTNDLCVLCNYSLLTYQMSVTDLYKNPSANQFTVVLLPSGGYDDYLPNNITKQFFTYNMSTYLDLKIVSYDIKTNNLRLTYSYNKTIQGQFMQIKYHPLISDLQPCSPHFITICNLKASNNIGLVYYSEQSYKQKYQNSKETYKVVQILAYITLFLSIIPAKIIAIELFGVLQLAYFCLANLDDVNLVLSPLMEMNELNGYNIMNSNTGQDIPHRIGSLDYSSSFLKNCNIMILVIFCLIFIGVIFIILGYVMKTVSTKMFSISKYILKEFLLGLILFNIFNISFSLSVHFLYESKNQNNDALSTLVGAVVLCLIGGMIYALLFTQSTQFGEWKDKLKPDFFCQSYFLFTIAYRFSLGFSIAWMNQNELGSLIIISFSIAFCMYNFIHLPYKSAYMNYRACICHITNFVTLLITNYYRSMKSTTALQIKSKIYSPAYIQLCLIVITLFVSICCLIYQIYEYITSKICADFNKVEPQQNQLKIQPNFITVQNLQNSSILKHGSNKTLFNDQK